jgi:hypothetical protein
MIKSTLPNDWLQMTIFTRLKDGVVSNCIWNMFDEDLT